MDIIDNNRQNDINFINANQSDFEGAMTIQSTNEGPHVLIVSGTHGNEHSGVSASLAFYRYLLENPQVLIRGAIHFLLANPKAYLQNTRYVEYDLNRLFNSTFEANYSGNRARQITEYLQNKKNLKAVLDLHSVSSGDNRMLVYNYNRPESFELAKTLSPISTHLAFHPEHVQGVMIEECSKLGARCLVVECGNHNGADSTQVAMYHIHKFLEHFELTSPILASQLNYQVTFKDNPNNEITQYETLCALVPDDNGFNYTRSNIQSGCFFKKGEVIATGSNKVFKAPDDCYMILPSNNVNITDHDAGFLCKKRTIKK
ncbi:MAG: succinylglutamate desuccinylase/aspartoacylase family protein [Bacteriovoracaceae bacterium]|nr:succinylglutamate desuccinylase/aspartoacylase family protein [Bacteriovoracaceae bacterium]